MKEVKKDRLAALALRLKELLASPTDKSLAESIGISLHVIHRMHARRVSSLSDENTKQVCSFLGIDLAEFEDYLQGKVTLQTITRNVKQATLTDLEESARALKILKKDILPKLAFADCLEVMREIQIKFCSSADNPVFAKRSLHDSPSSGLLPNVLTIAELLQDKNLDEMAKEVNLDRGRLEAISRGDKPRCEELTLLLACLRIPLKDLEVRLRQDVK